MYPAQTASPSVRVRLCYPSDFFFNDTAPTEFYTLSLHDALPISEPAGREAAVRDAVARYVALLEAHCRSDPRSEEHTSELQSRVDLVCRLLLEKKKRRYA